MIHSKWNNRKIFYLRCLCYRTLFIINIWFIIYLIFENSLNFTHEDENLFFGFKMAAYETIKTISDDKGNIVAANKLIIKSFK